MPKEEPLSRLLSFFFRRHRKKKRTPNAKDAETTPATTTPATCPFDSACAGIGVGLLDAEEDDVVDASDAMNNDVVGGDTNETIEEIAAEDVGASEEVVSNEEVGSSVAVVSRLEAVGVALARELASVVMSDPTSVVVPASEKDMSDEELCSSEAMLL